MQYRPLGRTGVQVSPLCLGAMMFGPWGNDDRADATRIIHRALDAGINFIDTADVYSGGATEEIVGQAIKDRRDDVFLATKFFMPMSENPNQRGGSRRWIFKEVENSLRRLDTDHIDLYQVHRPNPDTDVAETLGALTDLVRQGQGPLYRLVVVLRVADRRSPMGIPGTAPGAVRHRAAALLHPGPWDRRGCPTRRAAARHGHPDLQPSRRRLAVRPVAQGRSRNTHLRGPPRRPLQT